MFSRDLRLSLDEQSPGGQPPEGQSTPTDYIIPGQGQHPGYAIAKAFVIQFETKPAPERKIDPSEVQVELDRLQCAARQLEQEFNTLITGSAQDTATAALSDSVGYLQDSSSTMKRARDLITKELFSAECAVQKAFDDFVASIDDEFMRDRTFEAKDVKNRFIAILHPSGSDWTAQLKEHIAHVLEPSIIFIENISPAQALQLEAFQRSSQLVKGMIITHASPFGHQNMVLSGFDCPVMAGIDFKPLVQAGVIVPGQEVVLDVELGVIKTNLSSSARAEAYHKKDLMEAPEEVSLSTHAPRTRDGAQMSILGDLRSAEQMPEFTKRRITSIGLVRTELAVLLANRWLTQDELYREYTDILRSASPGAVSIRTYDFGFDKVPDFLKHTQMSASGLRGIRLMLTMFPEELSKQARALLLSAQTVGNEVRIIIPMVFNAGDMIRALQIFEQAGQDLVDSGALAKPPQNLSIGAMIETSSSIAMIDPILEESAFVSIGTRDLLLSMLGNDLSKASGAHYDPGFLFALRKVISASKAAGKDAFVCGEMPRHSQNVPLLIGVGATDLVVDPKNVGKINAMIAACDSQECKELVEQMITCSDDQMAHELRNAYLDKLNSPEIQPG